MPENAISYTGLRAAPPERQAKANSLREWLVVQVGALPGTFVVEQFNGGQSNPTFRVTCGNVRYVVRSKPLGDLLPSAHAVEREYRAMRALASTDVPVPRTIGLCEDAEVFGSVFYAMEHVEGRILWNQSLPGMAAAQRAAIYDELNRVAAAIHSVDPGRVGLHDFGRPENYLDRQIQRWTRQYRASETEPIPAMDRLIEWLPTRIPPQVGSGVVHGDYRIDNVIFHPREARIIAVLDWELSTLGDTLVDFAYHCLSWLLPPLNGRGLLGVPLQELGLPSQDAYLRSYRARLPTPIGVSPEHWRYYLAFNLFRLASILQGVAARAQQGNASSPHASLAASRVAPIAESALALAG